MFEDVFQVLFVGESGFSIVRKRSKGQPSSQLVCPIVVEVLGSKKLIEGRFDSTFRWDLFEAENIGGGW
jgi:hypothetical protein